MNRMPKLLVGGMQSLYMCFRLYTGFRRDRRRTAGPVFCLMALMIVMVAPLRAYTDPGSGLLIWQIVGAFFVGCVYQVRKFLIRIRKKK